MVRTNGLPLFVHFSKPDIALLSEKSNRGVVTPRSSPLWHPVLPVMPGYGKLHRLFWRLPENDVHGETPGLCSLRAPEIISGLRRQIIEQQFVLSDGGINDTIMFYLIESALATGLPVGVSV